MNESLQVRVRAFCSRTHTKKKDFADMIGISPVVLSHWLAGRMILNNLTVKKVCEILDQQDNK